MPLRLCVAVVGLLGAVAMTGCGASNHPNDPRPPAPIDVTTRVGNRDIVVSPKKFGAGLVRFTVSNQSDQNVALDVQGPVHQESSTIPPGAVSDDLKMNLKTGDYEVSGGRDSSAFPATLTVGPKRASSQNDLLLP
jgi:hypothetical protein